MTAAGMAHVALMSLALGVGAAIFLRPKGTIAHVTRGRVFGATVLVSDLLVFGIQDGSGRFGVFHVLAVVSIASVTSAIVILRLWRRSIGARIVHGHIMLWSFSGLVAAGLGQAATVMGFSPWPSILASFTVTAGIALRLDFKTMARLR